MMSKKYKFTTKEHLPVEHLIFKVAPEDVEEYLRVDHEVWTLGEAMWDGFDHIPFLSKETWINENKPGEMHFVFIWESLESWKKVDDKELQAAFIKEFESKFTKPNEFIYCGQNEENFGVHRYSRFERVDD